MHPTVSVSPKMSTKLPHCHCLLMNITLKTPQTGNVTSSCHSAFLFCSFHPSDAPHDFCQSSILLLSLPLTIPSEPTTTTSAYQHSHYAQISTASPETFMLYPPSPPHPPRLSKLLVPNLQKKNASPSALPCPPCTLPFLP